MSFHKFLWICLFVFCLCVFESFILSFWPSFFLLLVFLSIFVFVTLSVWMSVYQSFCLSVCSTFCPFVSLSICLFVCFLPDRYPICRGAPARFRQTSCSGWGPHDWITRDVDPDPGVLVRSGSGFWNEVGHGFHNVVGSGFGFQNLVRIWIWSDNKDLKFLLKSNL